MRRFLLLLLVASFTFACSGRTPSPKSAASMSEGFFKSYGRKYKSSFIGQAGVERAQINSIREISLNIAEIDGVVLFKNGQAARVLITAKKTPPLGWKVNSWEMLGGQ